MGRLNYSRSTKPLSKNSSIEQAQASAIEKWYHFDPQGETRALTNGSGTVTDSYRYTAYGVPLSSSGSTYNPYRYGGKYGYYTEGLSGLIKAGARWYHPYTFRWTSRDPIKYRGGENLYEYVLGNPVRYVDPTGLQAACSCPYALNPHSGYLFVSCNCVGQNIANNPEEPGGSCQNPAPCGTWNGSDGFQIGGDRFKLDGSTCTVISCSGGAYNFVTCIRPFGDLAGSTPPYGVNPGEFGGPPKELLPHTTPKPIGSPGGQ